MKKTFLYPVNAFLLLGCLTLLSAEPKKNFKPKISAASKEGQLAINQFRIPKGFKVELFAAEPRLANPVAFCIDEKGRFYVAETFRLHAGVTDIRRHMNWLDDDLACRTVEDRVQLYRKHLGKKFHTYATAEDRVRLIEDTNDDGLADRATIFADGFDSAAVGIGAGVLAHRGNVYFTCIPDLLLLKDTDNDGVAEVRKALHTGYGVHIGFLGHDLHGLKLGPDGRLYFSIGDRGVHIKTKEGVINVPDTGSVFRCDLDGSNLEVFASGLRNPQELAFDKHGNLFTGDNNSDGGDKARWVYLVEDSDSGWRIGYQFLKSPVARGPWNKEKMWHPQWDGQPAYLLPPIANLADGPSGLTYYPGVGLPKRYDDHFFLADFRGGPANSGIRSFAVKPKGATFELIDSHQFIWTTLPTDVDFGFDGNMYFSDWVNGWGQPTKGRIYRVRHTEAGKNPLLKDVKTLVAKGIHTLPQEKQLKLLEHEDMRVRQYAHLALADGKKKENIEPLAKIAKENNNQLARLHAMWSLGIIGREHPQAFDSMLGLLKDEDAVVRTQAAKVLGESSRADAVQPLIGLLKDAEARVRFYAAMTLGKLKSKEAIEPVLEMAKNNADVDRYLRHAAVMALVNINDRKAIEDASNDENKSVRMIALLAMRRLKMPEVAKFLHDAEPLLVVEAARAINGMYIYKAMDDLASLINQSPKSEATLQRLLSEGQKNKNMDVVVEPLLYRVLNANLHLRSIEYARNVAHFATRENVPIDLRVEAIRILDTWANPSGRDRVIGLWRKMIGADKSVPAMALRSHLGGIFSAPDRVRQEAARVAGRLGIKEVGPALLKLLKDQGRPTEVRVETLRALAVLKDAKLKEAIEVALATAQPELRHEGRHALATLSPDKVIPMLKEILKQGDKLPGKPDASLQKRANLIARQGAFDILKTLKREDAKGLLMTWLDRLIAGKVEAEVQLDLINAAEASPYKEVKAKLTKYEQSKPKDDPFAKYRESLVGGNADRGHEIFMYKSSVSCLRCHKVNNNGGEVGPNLTDLGLRQKRQYILESIVQPNKEIAKGFETVVLQTFSGKPVVGIIKEETKKEVKIITAEGKIVTVPVEDIDERDPGKSAMPEDAIKYLSRSELRDLVEFLSQQKTKLKSTK